MKKIQEQDLFINQIKAHPKYKIFTYNGKTYIKNAETEASLNHFIGHDASIAVINLTYNNSTAVLGESFEIFPSTYGDGRTYALSSGSSLLPDGLSIQNDGRIIGTLTATGLYNLDISNILVEASGTMGIEASQPFSIGVLGVAIPTPDHAWPLSSGSLSGSTYQDIVGGIGLDIVGSITPDDTAAIFPGVRNAGGYLREATPIAKTQKFCWAVQASANEIFTDNNTSKTLLNLGNAPASWTGAVLTIRSSDGQGRAAIYGGTSATEKIATAGSALPLGEWRSWVMSFDNDNNEITLDSEIDNSTIAQTANCVYGSNGFEVGRFSFNRNPTDLDRYWDGAMRWIQVWTTTSLTTKQRQTLVWLGVANIDPSTWWS